MGRRSCRNEPEDLPSAIKYCAFGGKAQKNTQITTSQLKSGISDCLYKKLLIPLVITYGSPQLLSQNSSASDLNTPEDTIRVQDIVITATKIPVARNLLAQPVQIISSDQLALSGGLDLSQILQSQTGLQINGAYSNPGKNKDVFIRGARSDFSLILIDGQPMYDAAGIGGVFDLRLIPVDQIERIEILKGNQSTLYGSDAIAGVINIITKAPDSRPINVQGSVRPGSYNSMSSEIAISGSNPETGYGISYSRFFTEGESEAIPQNDSLSYEKDRFVRNAIQFKGKKYLTGNLSLAPFFRYNWIEGGYDDGAFTDASNTFNSTWLNPGVEVQFFGERASISGLYNYIKTDRVFNNIFGENQFRSSAHNLEVNLNYEITTSIELLGGIYFQHRKLLDEMASLPNPEYSGQSPYVSLILKDFYQFNMQFGLRLNHHSVFGNHLTHSVAFSYSLLPGMRLFGAWQAGFKSPTLDQLFGQFGPNPDLDPQTSLSFESGIQLNFGNSGDYVLANYFSRGIDDVIIYDFTLGYQNQDRQNDHGIEIETAVRLFKSTRLSISYAFITGEITTPAQDGDTSFYNLIRIPKHSVNCSLQSKFFDYLIVELAGQFVGSRNDLFFNNNTFLTEQVFLQAYFLLHGHFKYDHPSYPISFYMALKNITDAGFIESTGFTTLGFHFDVGIQFRL